MAGEPVRQFRVTFQPSGISVTVLKGTNIFEAARMAGVPVVNACGGKGECMQCRVKLLHGSATADFEALFYLSQDEINQSFILACRTPVNEDVEVFVPGLRQSRNV